MKNTIVISTKTEDERRTLAEYICDTIKGAFNNAKEAGIDTRVFNPMVNAGTGADAGKYYVSMSCDKYDPRSVPARRAQIWVTSKGVEIWYGKVFELAFDGDKSKIFTSVAFVERVKRRKDGTPIDNTKERLITFHDIESFIPCVLSLMCDVIEGNERSYDVLLATLAQATQESEASTQESVKAQDKPKTQARRKKGTDKATGDEKTQTVEKKPRQKNKAE